MLSFAGVPYSGNIGLREIRADEEEGLTFGLGQRVGGAISKVEFGRVSAATVKEPSLLGNGQLLGIEGLLLEMELGKKEGEFEDSGRAATSAHDASCLESRHCGNESNRVHRQSYAQGWGKLFVLEHGEKRRGVNHQSGSPRVRSRVSRRRSGSRAQAAQR